MHKIIDPTTGELQAVIYHANCVEDGRQDIIPDQEMLQVSISKHGLNHHPAAHMHNFKDMPKRAITQECWVVMKGRVQVDFYNKSHGKKIHEAILSEGDIAVTLMGGHTFKTLEPSIIYEIKLGPYEGAEKDKTIIWKK